MHIVIVGGGFGGLKAALELDRKKNTKVTLISDKDHFVYYPTLYSVATGGSRRQSFVPVSEILRDTSVTFIQDTITGYNPSRRIVSGRKDYSYDRIIFALGVVTSYFGIRGLDKYSFSIKSQEEIVRFRRHIHDELTSSKKLDKQYVVVGAGPTGTELAASLASYIGYIARAHHIRHSRIRIKLVEAAPRVLPRMSEATSISATRRLESLGVDVMTNEKVEWQDDDEVSISGKRYPTRTVVWTSGVSNHPFFEDHAHEFSFSPNKRVVVDEHMMSGPHTYVIGDNAFTPYSGLAQTALHDAIYVARDILKSQQHQMRPVYQAICPPVVVPIGHRWAILEWYRIRITGLLGHLIHRIAMLVGYHDILPLGLAVSSWRAEEVREADCDICLQIH